MIHDIVSLYAIVLHFDSLMPSTFFLNSLRSVPGYSACHCPAQVLVRRSKRCECSSAPARIPTCSSCCFCRSGQESISPRTTRSICSTAWRPPTSGGPSTRPWRKAWRSTGAASFRSSVAASSRWSTRCPQRSSLRLGVLLSPEQFPRNACHLFPIPRY